MIIASEFYPVGAVQSRKPVDAAKRELKHFEICPMCDQAVDRRDIYAVMHHLPVGHRPLPVH